MTHTLKKIMWFCIGAYLGHQGFGYANDGNMAGVVRAIFLFITVVFIGYMMHHD